MGRINRMVANSMIDQSVTLKVRDDGVSGSDRRKTMRIDGAVYQEGLD